MTNEAKKSNLASKLEDARRNLLTITKTLSESNLQKKYATDEGTWTILDVIRHLSISEKGMTTLVQQIQRGEEGVPADFDLKRYNKRSVEKIADKNLPQILSEMETNRQNLFTVMKSMNDFDWGKKGRHASLRILTIEEVLNTIADHEANHLKKIKEKLAR